VPASLINFPTASISTTTITRPLGSTDTSSATKIETIALSWVIRSHLVWHVR